MQTVLSFILFSWLLWAVARGVFTLSVLFLLTSDYCKLNSVKCTLKFPSIFIYFWTTIFIFLSTYIVGQSIVYVVISLSMYTAIIASCYIRYWNWLKNNKNKKTSND